MIRFHVSMLTFALALTGTFCALASAQPIGQTPAPAPAAKARITNKEVYDYFKTFDANAKQVPTEKNEVFLFTYPHKGGNYPLQATMYDGNIWLTCRAAVVPDADKLAPELLAKMLRSHVPIGPTFFRISRQGDNDVIEIAHRIDRPADVLRLADALREMAGDIEATAPIWSKLMEKAPAK